MTTGFVAKAGETQLTEKHKYMYDGMYRIFGQQVYRNLFSLLTNYDGESANITDFFERARMEFVNNFCLNSKAVLNPSESFHVDESSVEISLEAIQFHNFFETARKLSDLISQMDPLKINR